ncbi:hypothetical protein pdam_00010546 [Pocillopora damicornis]|uniref:Uncharacterized protein n=1 Tax=Pocillopora damicornis TaxID=46731 RepID=A0A3M6V560_POCDA|nr:hypothetical protein pdam_00010546 [Pocillopora damicornis]
MGYILTLLWNIFMKIKQPEFELQDKLGHVWEYVRRSRSNTMDCQRTDEGEGCSNGDINNYQGHCQHPTDRNHIANYGIRGHQTDAMERLRQAAMATSSKSVNGKLPFG